MRASCVWLLSVSLAIGCGQSTPPQPGANQEMATGRSQVRPAWLEVLRGEKVGMCYPIHEGKNYLGRADELPVDIDFDDQELPERIWTSRQHAVITAENGQLTIEDLKSANGTFVNRQRVRPGNPQPLKPGDLLQVGTVSMKVLAAGPQPKASEATSRQGRLVVLRGEKIGVEYPIYPGLNYIGRADELAVDIDLDDQEQVDRTWTSRQHALVRAENGQLSIEDLKSANGTFVNRKRVYPGDRVALKVDDIIQLGTVQLKVAAQSK